MRMPYWRLARRHRLTFYDAAYLELAKREGCALATFDRRTDRRRQGRARTARMSIPLVIRPARKDDAAAIWAIIGPTIRAGETYTLPPDMSERAALDYWMGPDRETLRRGGERPHPRHLLPARQPGGRRQSCRQLRIHDPRRCHRPRHRAAHVRALAGACALARLSRHAVQLCGRDQRARGPACGNRWVSRSSAACRLRFAIRRSGYVDALVMYRAL